MTSSAALPAVLSGLGLGLSLIVAIGAQNAFVLRQGLRGEYVAAVVAVCAASDLALIVAGVLGAGELLGRVPWLLPAVRWGGAAFLVGYAVLAARRAVRPGALQTEDALAVTPLAGTLTTCLLLTWLNPHVYLDTVVLLGSIAQTHGATGRWWFAVGAGLGSVLWFSALGYGARLLRPVFARQLAWRVLDVLIAAVMTTLAVTLALSA